MTIRLASAETSTLAALCRTQVAWDPDAAARIKIGTSAVGVFTTPPLGVLVLVALPADVPAESTNADVTVRLDSLLAAAENREGDGSAAIDVRVLRSALVELRDGPSLAHLPPSSGWGEAVHGVDRDVAAETDAATAEFDARAAGLGARLQEAIAEDLWNRPAFAGLPLRVLHAARRLGLLAGGEAPVSAAACGPWRRLSTQRGQVFARASGSLLQVPVQVLR